MAEVKGKELEIKGNHTEIFNNPLLVSFLSNPKNLKLYKETINKSCEEDKKALDDAFKTHFLTARFTSYLSKSIYYEAINYDKKRREQNDKQTLTLDASAAGTEGVSLVNFIPEENTDYLPVNAYEKKQKDIEDIITDSKLYQIVSTLTENQKEILSLAYVKQLRDVEIAKILKKSQQAISRSHQRALEIIRESLSSC
jgi:RNA polymerase sigma factor (sigma-70 family)